MEPAGSKIKELKELLASIEDKYPEKRITVVKYFWKATNHVTVEDLFKKMTELGENIDCKFIEDTLNLLVKLGIAVKTSFENRPDIYELKFIGDHHDHMICIECGKIIEFEDHTLETMQDAVASRYNFTLLHHRMEFYGFCRSCSMKRGETMMLHSAKKGEALEVTDINGGTRLIKRCAEMGIYKNARVEILSTNKGGQLIVACGGSRYVIGKGLSNKITVKRIKEDNISNQNDIPCHICRKNDFQLSDNTMKREEAKFLSSFKNQDKGIITSVGGCKRLRMRLFEMGLLNGSQFEVVKYAPLKDPMEIIVKNTHISLRVDEARHIMARKIEG